MTWKTILKYKRFPTLSDVIDIFTRNGLKDVTDSVKLAGVGRERYFRPKDTHPDGSYFYRSPLFSNYEGNLFIIDPEYPDGHFGGRSNFLSTQEVIVDIPNFRPAKPERVKITTIKDAEDVAKKYLEFHKKAVEVRTKMDEAEKTFREKLREHQEQI